MSLLNKLNLQNGIDLITKVNEKTPRIAFTLYIKINEQEKYSGLYSLLNRLFFQGTKKYSSSDLASILEENAIECYSNLKSDSLQFKIFCLNDDFDLALDILSEIIKNSTFEDLEKEKIKLKGEIEARLDSPKSLAYDAFYRNLYIGHHYGNTMTKTLEDLDKIQKADIIDAYNKIINNSQKVMSIVGDFNQDEIVKIINNKFNYLGYQNVESKIDEVTLNKAKIIKIEKEDVAQAQIILGYLCATYKSEDYAPIVVMNTLLGACGLSSRLFLELRDKKGLAYVVRSSYEVYNKSANINVYIATNPNNIKTSIDGFLFEIERIKKTDITDEELENTKNNILGKRNFYYETNILESSMYSGFEINGLGFNYEEEFIKKIKKVKIQDIKKVADRYFSDKFILTILAQKEYLSQIDDKNLINNFVG